MRIKYDVPSFYMSPTIPFWSTRLYSSSHLLFHVHEDAWILTDGLRKEEQASKDIGRIFQVLPDLNDQSMVSLLGFPPWENVSHTSELQGLHVRYTLIVLAAYLFLHSYMLNVHVHVLVRRQGCKLYILQPRSGK